MYKHYKDVDLHYVQFDTNDDGWVHENMKHGIMQKCI